MTPGQKFGNPWGRGARDWADLMEPHYYLLDETVHGRLGVRGGTRLLDVERGPGGAVLLASVRVRTWRASMHRLVQSKWH
jgi:hypothetical protein